MIRDDKKVLLLQKQQPVKPTIYLYTSAGKLIEQLQVGYLSIRLLQFYFNLPSYFFSSFPYE